MPKLDPRCNRRGRYGSSSISSNSVKLAFLAPPRKVSFEDGHQDDSRHLESNVEKSSNADSQQADPCCDGLSVPKEASLSTLSRKRKSSLIRPTTSKCLVDLAKDADEDDEGRTSSPQSAPQRPQQLFSAPVSPVPQGSDDGFVDSPSAMATPSSPWGHFVEIIPSEGQGTNQCASSKMVHDGRCNCCATCRRRRASPYGDVYKKSASRRPLCFLQGDGARPLLPVSVGRNGGGDGASSWRLPSFKLQPSRPHLFASPNDLHHPAEQLVSALHEMRFE